MKRTTGLMTMLILSAVVALAVVPRAQSSKAEVALRQAIETETVKGDVKAAIEMYKKLANGSDRAVAAQALIRLGQCYEKSGQSDARKTYEQVIEKFKDQAEAVGQARSRLVALGAGAVGPSAGPRMVWKAPDLITQPVAISQNGRYLAVNNGTDLLVRDLVSGIDRQVTKGDNGNYADCCAVFSRDGMRIAYTWWSADHSELQVVDLRTSGIPQPKVLKRLAGMEGFPSMYVYDWTPDGKLIAVGLLDWPSTTEQIALVSTDDGSLQALKSLKSIAAWSGNARISLDGKYLAYDSAAPGGSAKDIFVLPVAGGPDIPAVVSRFDDQLVGWSPDGTRLVFTSDRTGSNSLYALPIRDGQAQGAPELIRSDVGLSRTLSLSASGSLYYGASSPLVSNSDIKIASFDFNTGQILSPPSDLVREYSLGSNSSPAWSPDGKLVAYLSERANGRERRVIIRSVETGEILTELRPRLTNLSYLRWNPDGGSFMVRGLNPEGRVGLFRVDRSTAEVTSVVLVDSGSPGSTQYNFSGWSGDGKRVQLRRGSTGGAELTLVERDLTSGAERDIFRGEAVNTPVLSPDGRKVYYRRVIPGSSQPPFEEMAIIERDLPAGTDRELIRGALPLGLSLSPDGRYIATPRNDASTKSRSIQIISVAGGATRDLMRVDLVELRTVDGLGPINPLSVRLWAPDSRSLLLVKGVGGDKPNELWWVPTDGRATAKLVDLPKFTDLSVSPDGRRLAMTVIPERVPRQPSELWVLENFLPKAVK